MKDKAQSDTVRDGAVTAVANALIHLLQPHKMYLYNQKFSVSGATQSFKVCVVAPLADKASVEREIYLGIDSEVPFDVILYTPPEWERLCQSPDSFARKILLTGTLLHG